MQDVTLRKINLHFSRVKIVKKWCYPKQIARKMKMVYFNRIGSVGEPVKNRPKSETQKGINMTS